MSIKENILHKLIDGTYSAGGGGTDLTQGGVIETGNLIIDTDNTEALLVRKDNDSGNIFRVDTINERIEYKDGNQQAGYVLTSDANGVGTWQTGSVSQLTLVDGNKTTPSINFINDTDMGLYRVGTGEMNYVKGSAPILTLDSGSATVNAEMNARTFQMGNVTYNDGGSLGTILAVYDYDVDALTSTTGALDFTTTVGAAPTLTASVSGRTNVLLTNISGGQYTEDAADIASIQGLTDFYISFWFYAFGGVDGSNVFSWHNGATGLASATDSIVIKADNPSSVNTRFILEVTKASSVILTVNLSNFFSVWRHFVFSFSTTSGCKIWQDNSLSYSNGTFLESLSTIPITRFTKGDDDGGYWCNGYMDTVVFVAGTADNTKVDDLFNDVFNFTGLPSFASQSRLTYDTGDGKTKLELLPSGDDVFTANTTEFEIVKSLKYTGATPADGYVLTSNASGSATWQPSSSSSLTLLGDKTVSITNHDIFSSTNNGEAIYNFITGSLLDDSSGNSRTLSQTGSPTYGSFEGKPHTYFTNSTSIYVSSTALATAVAGVDTVVSVWFNTSSSSTASALWSVDDTTANNQLGLLCNNGTITVIKGTSGVLDINCSVVTAGWNDGLWHHMVVNCLSGGLSIYIDNSLQSLSFTTGGAGTNATPPAGVTEFFFGKRGFGTTSGFGGYLTSIMIKSSTVTADEIESIYNGVTLGEGQKLTLQDAHADYLTISQQLTYTGAPPTNGYFLQTDGNGDATWVNVTTSSDTAMTWTSTNITGSVATTVRVRKVGDVINLTFPTISWTGNGGAGIVTNNTGTLLPAAYRPTQDIYLSTPTNNNSIIAIGYYEILTSGQINVRAEANSDNFLGSSTNTIYSVSISYTL